MNKVVVYYSGKGSNKYLAGKAADALGCKAVEIMPRAPGLVIAATMTKISLGIKPVDMIFENFDRVVVCGPLYIGSIAAPCADFIRKYGKKIKKLDFITCCGSSDEKKDEKLGYGKAFEKLKLSLGNKAGLFEAFPVGLVLSEEQREDDEAMMNARFDDTNFTGAVKERLDAFTEKLIHA